MVKYLTTVVFLLLTIFTVINKTYSAKLYSGSSSHDNDGENDDSFEEEETFNELGSLKCLPSGFPCSPHVQHSSIKATTKHAEKEEEEAEFPTTDSTTAVTYNEEKITDATTEEFLPTTTIIPSTPFPSKFRNFPSSCCTKCLYEPGWIDAVCA